MSLEISNLFLGMVKTIVSLIGVIICLNTSAQTFSCPSTPSLKYLYNSKSEIPKISHTEDLVLFEPAIENWRARFKLIKNKSGLFALVNGTGQVYKAINIDDQNITFNRIDSTRFLGYNFDAIDFSYNETIYSFGGYGFWIRNGHLTHFTPGAEWTIDKINETYKTTNKFYSYRPKESKIYYIEFPWDSEATFDKIINSTVVEFDIKKRENKQLGKLNPKISFSYKYFSIDIQSLNGVLNFNEGEIYLYNFSANKVYKLTNLKIKDALVGKSGTELEITFEDSGKLYYSFNNDTTLRSLEISMNDFKEEDYLIYIPENKNTYLWIALIIIIIIVSTLGLYKLSKRKKTTKEHFIEETYTVDLNSNEFNSIETSLIDKLIEKSNIDSHLTVDELNSILGIKKKTIEIQKRVRTEAINRINHKFNVNFNLETNFIERTRSNEDRRYFNYIINKSNAKIYQKK